MFKKLLTYSVVITTMVWSVGLLTTPLAVGAASSGDLIKLQCAAGAGVNDPCKAVYYLGADAKRYVFPNEKTYKTWYSDFSGVTTVSSTEMSSYSIGGNVTYRPGVKLVKITTDPKVYAVGKNGSLRWVTTGAAAEALYGATWTKMVEDVPDAFFVNYTVGADITAAADYDKADVMADSNTINADKNLGGAASSGTGLTVALAADTPASGIVVANSINNKFTKVNLTASADGDIVIDQLVVKRGGTVASDSPFSSIALIDVATGQRIGNTKTLNSNHEAVFNQDITIAAGTTKSIYLAGNMGATASYAGEIPSLDLQSLTLSGSAVVVGTLPIVGNYQNINGTITIGALTVANGGNNPDASTQKVGTTNYIVSSIKLTNNSVEDFKVSQITFDQGGTADDEDVKDLELLVDDAVVATVAAPSDGKVFFNLAASPISILKGKNATLDLRADINSGSARTIRFDISDESDLVAKGQTYGAEVKVSAGTGATADAEPFWTAPVTTVGTGTLNITPATLISANIPNDSDQQVLAKFTFEVKGEPVEITSLPVNFTISTTTGSAVTAADLTAVTIYDENGSIVSGPDDSVLQADVDGSSTLYVGVTSTDTITVPIGEHVYTVKADVSVDFAANDTIVARINPAKITAKGETTGLTITPTPSADQGSATMTVKSAALAVSTLPDPIAQTVVAGVNGWTFAKINLDAANSGEDVKVTSVKVAIHTTTAASPSQTSNWKIYDGTTELSVSNDPSSDASAKTTAGNSATATFTLSTPLIITKGTAKTLTVKANISSSATTGTVKAGISDSTASSAVVAKGASSSSDATVTYSVSDGQAQTITSAGKLEITSHSDTPDAGLIPANTSGVTAAVMSLTAKYEDVNVEKMYITGSAVNTGGWDQVKKLYIYNGSTLVKEVTPTSTDGTDKTVLVDITNSPLVVPKDGAVTLTFKIDTPTLNYELSGDGSGIPSSWQGIQLKINASGDVTAKGASSGDAVSGTSLVVTSAQGNSLYLVRTLPTITLSEAGGTFPAATANKDLSSFTVAADSAADLGLLQVSYTLATTTATVTDLYLYEGGTLVATASTTPTPIDSSSTGNTDGWEDVITFFLTTNGAIPNNTTAGAKNLLPSNAIVKAGLQKTYTLNAKVECGAGCTGSTGTGTVIVKFLGDSASVGTGPVKASTKVDGALATYEYEYSILWTDFWRTPTLGRASTTATSTEQWLNGYLLKSSATNYLRSTSTGATWSKAAQ